MLLKRIPKIRVNLCTSIYVMLIKITHISQHRYFKTPLFSVMLHVAYLLVASRYINNEMKYNNTSFFVSIVALIFSFVLNHFMKYS